MESKNYIPEVKEQYENFPYPARNPEDEKAVLIATNLDNLDFLNFACFSGKKNFDNNFRVLVAGGGTGDATIFLGEQLRGTGAEIIQLDLSSASLDIAKKRAEIRKLDNIKFMQGSLLDLANLTLGKFDYINCSGVLHHLENPDAGLKSLKSALKDEGAIGIMVYAKHGRRGIYMMQELMRIINKNATSMKQKIENTKKVLAGIPENHPYRQAEPLFNKKRLELADDIEIYDMFLHSQDRAYTIPEAIEWLKKAGLNIAMLLDNGLENITYSVNSYIKDPAIAAALATASIEEKLAAAELFNGTMFKHRFYATPHKAVIPNPLDPESVPFFSSIYRQENIYKLFYNHIKDSTHDRVEIPHNGFKIQIPLNAIAKKFFQLLDGKKTVEELISTIQKQTLEKEEDVRKIYLEIFTKFNFLALMLLKHKSSDYETLSAVELQKRCAEKYLGAEKSPASVEDAESKAPQGVLL